MVAEEYQDGWMRGINLRDLQVRGGAQKYDCVFCCHAMSRTLVIKRLQTRCCSYSLNKEISDTCILP